MFSRKSATKAECEQLKSRGLVNDCYYDKDYFAGAVKKCNEYKLHLPSPQTLALIAGTRYGRTDITSTTLIMKNGNSDGRTTYADCHDYYKKITTAIEMQLVK